MPPETTAETTPAAAAAAATPPAVDVDKIAAQVLEGTKKHIGELTKTMAKDVEKNLDEKTAAALTAQQKRVAAAIGLSSSEDNDQERFAEVLATKPLDVIARAVELGRSAAVKDTKQMLDDRDKVDRDNRSQAKVVTTVLKERPDIKETPEAMAVLDSCFLQTDEALPFEDRLKKSIEQYDLLMEKNGAGDSKARIAKASSVRSAGGPQNNAGPQGRSEGEIRSASQQRTLEAFKAKRGRLPNRLSPN